MSSRRAAEVGTLLRRRRRRRRELRDDISRRQFHVRFQLALGVLWLVLAAVRWLDDDTAFWLDVAWVVLAVGYLGSALVMWRQLREDRSRLAALVGVDLVPVTEARLARLVAAALDGAAADEVTPGQRWTPERVEWLRGFHRDRRRGLDGPHQEATWAVVEVRGESRDDEHVVGSARLRRSGDAGVVETGLWLVRDARGRGVGRQVLHLVLERAREAGATTVRAETTAGNAAAVGVLRSSGAVVTVDGDVAQAEIPLSGPAVGPG
ncbi:GNAT family N-acetyltransferase [Blastococcus goldschmidtiae]|uniref:GNAT family N-acetyltransferase n=1 Tax=Blastococcus goldschmidtiae TaxID=3075546 RepID=A0ABU2K9T0_9ACTN|nr:GNAT family N-acetyltransferase [Blastococcus sp. DSM 46792]MDT0276956.1 GNAT family N-acetyltransferase [Blastococcus sp. DSM 46792]